MNENDKLLMEIHSDIQVLKNNCESRCQRLEELEKEVKSLSRWRWINTGIAIAVGFVLDIAK